jgi:hypothetical protein
MMMIDKHNEKEMKIIARLKARRIVRLFKKTQDSEFISNAQIYQKGIIKTLKEHDIISEFENEVLTQITKL